MVPWVGQGRASADADQLGKLAALPCLLALPAVLALGGVFVRQMLVKC